MIKTIMRHFELESLTQTIKSHDFIRVIRAIYNINHYEFAIFICSLYFYHREELDRLWKQDPIVDS